MKEVVQKSKQTLWIFTMLTVMVVLSAYYLVSDPIVPNMATENVNSDESLATDITTDNVTNLIDSASETTTSPSDLFIGLKMDRDNNRTKQLDQLYAMMQSDLSEESIAGIQQKIERLQSVEESEFVLEKLIMADGFDDAVVLANDNSVDVIVQSDALTNANAVKIIKMVSDRLNMPAVNVHIKTVK